MNRQRGDLLPFFVCELQYEALFGETVRGAFWAVSDAFFGVCLCRIQQKRGVFGECLRPFFGVCLYRIQQKRAVRGAFLGSV